MAYLVRRRDTFVMRLLLLPTVIFLTVHSAHNFYWPQPWLQAYNWAQSLVSAQLIAKALDFALTPIGRLKVGETKLPRIGGEDTHTPSSPTAKHRAANPSFLPPAVNDAFEVLFAFRGLGWDFGQGAHVPKEDRPLERGAFLKATRRVFFKYFLLFDLLDSCMKLIPEVGSPFGGTIFFPLPPIQRYVVSTTIHLMTGIMVLTGFEVVYALMTLVGVGLLRQSPLLWPPFFDRPFSSDSLTVFWAKRWHQSLRRMFIIFGGYPGYWLGSWISQEAAKVAMLFGVFIASGLFHELTTYTTGKGFDKNTTLFFVWQGVAVLVERIWYKVTGRKVQGWTGLIWVYFCIMVLGQPCVNAWHHRGLGGSVIVPTLVSPTRNFLWPILRRVHPVFEFLP
ncbi:hypothetical protein BDM02DRAFT_3113833 [Thelephora ganbajun]|uniref:Uncharacterized protein n=1 Tax=Thelephora ganbajun TaxID=370292 RepID=A0ACB6ZIR9_THEGA|nr:hypothetical protein BDM02DRAFT_3113833 [Thelephora ganbajun]